MSDVYLLREIRDELKELNKSTRKIKELKTQQSEKEGFENE